MKSENYQIKAGILVIFTMLIALASSGYLMYSRGVLDKTYILSLSANDASDLAVGMPLTLSGFPIGNVSKFELDKTGRVLIQIRVTKKNLERLREGSTFWSERNIFGGLRLTMKNYSPLQPTLDLSKIYPLIENDVTSQIPGVISNIDGLITNLATISSPASDLSQTLSNLAKLTNLIEAEQGALPALVGQKNSELIKEVLTHIHSISEAVAESTEDIDQLRNDIDSDMRKINYLIDDLNSRWPFKGQAELTTP